MSSYVNCLGGRCPHMPFFIGGHMSGGGGGGGGKCPTLDNLTWNKVYFLPKFTLDSTSVSPICWRPLKTF